jgi:hypothetical protein
MISAWLDEAVLALSVLCALGTIIGAHRAMRKQGFQFFWIAVILVCVYVVLLRSSYLLGMVAYTPERLVRGEPIIICLLILEMSHAIRARKC